MGILLQINLIFVATDIFKASSLKESLFNHPKVISFDFVVDFVLAVIVLAGPSEIIFVESKKLALVALITFCFTFVCKIMCLAKYGCRAKTRLEEELTLEFKKWVFNRGLQDLY